MAVPVAMISTAIFGSPGDFGLFDNFEIIVFLNSNRGEKDLIALSLKYYNSILSDFFLD